MVNIFDLPRAEVIRIAVFVEMESEFRHVERTPLTPIQSEGKTSGIFTKQAVNEPRSKRVPNHASRSENHSFGQPHTRLQDGQARNNTSPAKAKQRTNSLRRAKNSSEVLRQRALKRSNTIDVPPEGIGISGLGGREARHFTVGNVGHNGKMYLRYGDTINSWIFGVKAQYELII